MQSPAKQPIGFWTVRAGEAIRARTRGALEAIGVSQPEWWVLHQLTLHPDGMPRTEMVDTIGPNDTPEAIETAIESAAGKGWLRARGEVLHPTDTGSAVFERAMAVQTMLEDERMQGVTEEDYATAITVMQRVIENVGGSAWHW